MHDVFGRSRTFPETRVLRVHADGNAMRRVVVETGGGGRSGG
jgi:hypothetical protein